MAATFSSRDTTMPSGVHFNRAYVLLGGMLAVMAVGLGYLDQLTLFGLPTPLSVVAIRVPIKRHGRRR